MGSDQLHLLGKEIGYAKADVDLGLTTMSRRAGLLGSAYPFRVASGGVACTDDTVKSPWVTLLLMSSDSPLRRGMNIPVVAAHLERITATALESLFGPGTSAIRFGAGDEGRPAALSDAVQWLARLMNVPVGSAYRPPYGKDGGVDVVAWRPFPDRRSGFPVLLAQCTLERDYAHKAADVDVRVWSGYLRLDVEPLTALAVPEVVPSGEEWNSLAARTVVLDRIRLTTLITANESNVEALEVVFEWLQKQLQVLRTIA